MILIDVNLLLYADVAMYTQHVTAKTWLDGILNGNERVGLPWESLNGFMRLATNPRIFTQPLNVAEAWLRVQSWLAHPVVWTPAAGPQHVAIFDMLVAGKSMTTKHVPDAHLASLAIEHDLTLCSADKGFATYPGLKWQNPLSP